MASHPEFWTAAAGAAPVIAILHEVAVRGRARAYAEVVDAVSEEALRRADKRTILGLALRIYVRQLLALLYLLIYAADVFVFVVAMASLVYGRDEAPPVLVVWILTLTLSTPAVVAYGSSRVVEVRASIRILKYLSRMLRRSRR